MVKKFIDLKRWFKRNFYKIEKVFSMNSRVELALSKDLYELLSEWGQHQIPGLHVYETNCLSEMDTDTYTVYSSGYCFHVYKADEWESEGIPEYGFWSGYEGFKQGLSLPHAIVLVKKAYEK